MNETLLPGQLVECEKTKQRSHQDRSRRPRNKLVFALFILLAFIALQAVITVFGGSVSGEQFCPDLFQRRHFSYRQIPWLRVQVTPVVHTMVTNDLETYLANNRSIPFVRGGKSRWDLVHTNSITGKGFVGDAADLCAYLDQHNGEGKRKWLTWTEENPSLEKVLWPTVTEVAKEGLYHFCPDMFQIAESASNAQTLQRQLDQLLADKYTRLADARRLLDQPISAKRLYRLALVHVANHPRAQKGLATLKRGEAPSDARESALSPAS